MARTPKPKKQKKPLKRKPTERKVCAFRVNDAEAREIAQLIEQINAQAQARGIAPFLKADVLRAAALEWAGRSSARNAQGKAVAAHLGEKW